MTTFAGTGALVRAALRRDRIMLPVWIYVIIGAVGSNFYTLGHLYPNQASRDSLATGAGHNPALTFLYARMFGTSLGAIGAWRYEVWVGIFASLMSVFIVIRHSRGDEESGRMELIGSTAVGRHAPLTAALLVAYIANLVVIVVLPLVLIFEKLPAAGSVALAVSVGLCGAAFASIAALTAQLSSGARAARGIALGVLGATFMLRGIGDAAGAQGPSWLTWASPLGWIEFVRPYAGERWWVLALPVLLAVVATGAAYWLAAARDYDAGLLPDRPGPGAASRWLRDSFALAWRLQRAALAGWAAGFVLICLACGAAAVGVGSILNGSAGMRREMTYLGGPTGIVNAFLAAIMLLSGLVAAGYATSVVLRLRSEETGGLAEPVLVTGTGRARWALSHVLVAVIGTAVLLALAGVSTALGYAMRSGSAGAGAIGGGTGGTGTDVARMLGASMAQLPSTLVVAGVAVLLFGLFPGLVIGGSWTAVGVVVFLDLFGQALQLSHWALDISPFTHAPRLPGGSVHLPPLLWLIGVFVLLCAAGLVALRRRDLAT
jgi:ABC-2 type transport system permease protein